MNMLSVISFRQKFRGAKLLPENQFHAKVLRAKLYFTLKFRERNFSVKCGNQLSTEAQINRYFTTKGLRVGLPLHDIV
ncbi:MAG: hypothetical protein DRR16_18630 [Candidatus Parabeggiatoa sp. nov. 3]|nr:MAG: hypothetical protein DRR00_17150 [Gammaproteobacteria bacterium]RKZ65200.1 MAG: hypothetical protein DRQ99_13335 [Gammaproteobacteria bacterium]RKZ82904.1 MAG: hypothetical protein DRR16_18630 [Gammaproteobacteria bacterium]